MDKLEELNLIPIEDYSVSCGEIEYIYIEDNKENRETLIKLGATDEDFEEIAIDGGVLDITIFPFSKLGAEYWNKVTGFSYERIPNYHH